MKFVFRNHILRLAGYMEIFLAIMLLVGVMIASIGLLKSLYGISLNFSNTTYFHSFLGYTMALIIAVELIKMITRNTPGSTIEVLLFAISRKLIVSEENSLGFLIGVIALGLLFSIRKFLFVPQFTTEEGVIISAAMTITEAKKISGHQLPDLANTIGGLVSYIAQQENRKLREGEIYEINGVKMRINRLQNGIIEVVEFVKSED